MGKTRAHCAFTVVTESVAVTLSDFRTYFMRRSNEAVTKEKLMRQENFRTKGSLIYIKLYLFI